MFCDINHIVITAVSNLSPVVHPHSCSEHSQAVFGIVMLKKTGTAPLAGAADMDVHVTAVAQPC